MDIPSDMATAAIYLDLADKRPPHHHFHRRVVGLAGGLWAINITLANGPDAHSAQQDVEDTKFGYALNQSGRIRLTK
jgi:hypothetical protein